MTSAELFGRHVRHIASRADDGRMEEQGNGGRQETIEQDTDTDTRIQRLRQREEHPPSVFAMIHSFDSVLTHKTIRFLGYHEN